MSRVLMGLLTGVWVALLVPVVWFIALSPRLLETNPGETLTFRMGLFVAGIWLFPVTVTLAIVLAWRRKPVAILAPGAHLLALVFLAFLMGTFA